MKYKFIAIIGIIVAIVSAFTFDKIEFREKRYHQHIEADVRAEDVVSKDEFATHLPIIKIETDGDMPNPYTYKTVVQDGKTIIEEGKNYETVNSNIKYIQNEGKENKINDTPVFESNAKFRTRGNSSRAFDKKGYSIKFMNDDYSEKRDIEIDNMVADSDWALHGPYMDKTLIRNYICYNIAGESLNVFSPEVRFCEVFVNNDYKGLYLLVEEINYNKDGRLDINKSDPDSKETSYILKIDKPSRKENENIKSFFYDTYRRESDTNNRVSIRYPSKTMTKEQREYIEDKYYDIERTISSGSLLNIDEGYRKYIDVDSFVDYFIINEFASNLDVLNRSTFIYSDLKSGKTKTAIWDFNNAFGNFSHDNPKDRFVMTDRWWYKELLKDKLFTGRIIKRYRYLRKNILSDEYIDKYIDDTIEYLGPAIERNYKRWPNVMKKDFLREGNKFTYEDNVKYLKDNIKERGEFLDKNIESIKYYSHESNNK